MSCVGRLVIDGVLSIMSDKFQGQTVVVVKKIEFPEVLINNTCA
jgi:hypothetical protein